MYKAGTFSILILYLCIFQHIVICLNIQLWTVFCSISCTHFSISHWPPQGAVQAGQIKVPPGYHPIDVEKEWGRLHVSILEREKLLRIEFERWESSGRPQRWNTLTQPLIISQRRQRFTIAYCNSWLPKTDLTPLPFWIGSVFWYAPPLPPLLCKTVWQNMLILLRCNFQSVSHHWGCIYR